MPTNRQRIIAVAASIAITVGGAWAASLVPASVAGAGDAASVSVSHGLSVTISDVRNGAGKVVILVFDDRDAFKAYDADKAVGYQEISATAGEAVASFPDLTSGPYAVAAFHDENGNRDLDMDGETPTEGYATSGATGAYDEPTFARAAAPAGEVSMRMHYLTR